METPGPGQYDPVELDKQGYKRTQPLTISSSFFMSDTERFGRGNIPGNMYRVVASDQIAPTSYDGNSLGKKSFHRNVNKSWL